MAPRNKQIAIATQNSNHKNIDFLSVILNNISCYLYFNFSLGFFLSLFVRFFYAKKFGVK